MPVQPPGRTATILPFPARPKVAALTPDERLTQALASLNAALAEQRVAVAAWRDVLGQLKTSTNCLHDSLQSYRTNLNALGKSVSSLRSKTASLEAWANDTAMTPD